jgi:hypothetical protein
MLPVSAGDGRGALLLAARRPLSGGRRRAPPAPGAWLTSLLLTLAAALLAFEAWRYAGGPRLPPAARRPAARRALPDRRFPAPHLRSLVLVACHSVYTGLDFKHPEDASSWLLLDYQKDVPGQAHSFFEHIRLGVDLAADNPHAMLLFSGGKTRRDAGPRAEAMGYWLVAEGEGWFGRGAAVRARAFTEEHARDSLENLLFGLCRFYELTGAYPEAVTVVGYDFKRERFAALHRAALRWPPARFQYVGTPALTPGAEEVRGGPAALLRHGAPRCAPSPIPPPHPTPPHPISRRAAAAGRGGDGGRVRGRPLRVRRGAGLKARGAGPLCGRRVRGGAVPRAGWGAAPLRAGAVRRAAALGRRGGGGGGGVAARVPSTAPSSLHAGVRVHCVLNRCKQRNAARVNYNLQTNTRLRLLQIASRSPALSHTPPRRVLPMSALMACAATSRPLSSGSPVMGDSALRRSQSSMARRSYTKPSAANTGSNIVSWVMGQVVAS